MRKQADYIHTRDETSKDEKQHDAVDKYNRSVFWMVVTFVVPKTGPIHLGLTADRQAGRRKPCYFKKIKSYNLTSNVFFEYLNRFSDYFTLYQKFNS